MKIINNISNKSSSIAALHFNGVPPLLLNVYSKAINQKNNKITKAFFQYLLLTTIYLLLTTNYSFSQDLHFSQYHNAPLITNPANTGFSPESDYRIGLNSRTQWAATNVPYKTTSAWADAQLFKSKIENGWLGLGAVVLSDVAGTGNLTATKTYVNVAYHQLLNDNNLLSIGLGAGWVQKRIDYDKLIFNDQWNENFFDINIKTGEQFFSNSVSYLDLNAGINYAWFATDNFYLNTGVSVLHINTPQETFFNPKTTHTQLERRYNFFINASIKLNDIWILNPNIYYSKISTAQEIVIGLNGQYNMSGDGTNQLLFGLHYRNKDAVIPALGYQIKSMQLMFDYDVTTSTLNSYSNYKSAYELSAVWKGIYGSANNGQRAVRCSSPKF